MTFLRSCYKTAFRPFQDNDTEVTLRWYFAEPDAPVLGYPSRIRPLRETAFPWLAEGVGEVYGAPTPFYRGTRIPHLKYQHVCGTREDFEAGGEYDEELPPVVYDDQGLPTCCVPPFVGQGGAVGSGTADVSVTQSVSTTCATAVTAHAGIWYTVPFPTSGFYWWNFPDAVPVAEFTLEVSVPFFSYLLVVSYGPCPGGTCPVKTVVSPTERVYLRIPGTPQHFAIGPYGGSPTLMFRYTI